MNIKLTDEFDEGVRRSLDNVYKKLPRESQTPFNDPAFYQICWDNFSKKVKCIGIIGYDQNKIIGGIFFRQSDVRIGLRKFSALVPLTYGFTDFTPLLVLPPYKELFLKKLVLLLKNKSEHALFPNILQSDTSILSDTTIKLCETSVVLNPLTVNNEGVFEKIIEKKSLKRRYRQFTKMGNLKISHYDKLLPDEANSLVNKLVDLHKERWSFNGVKSKFYQSEFIDVYKQLLINPDGFKNSKIVLTTISLNKIYVAMHLGFLWNNTFLYQIPAINIEFFKYWPGELLMKELYSLAIQRDVNVFDLGYGDEEYKSRYSNESSKYTSFFLFNNLIELNQYKTTKYSYKLVKGLNYALLISRMRKIKLKVLGNHILLYRKKDVLPFLGKLQFDLKRITSFREFVNFQRSNNCFPYHLGHKIYDRFQLGYTFCVLQKGKESLSYGWVFESSEVYIGEIGKKYRVMRDHAKPTKDPIWILDCITPIERRGQGFYSHLLKSIGDFYSNNDLYIYTSHDNIPSQKGIAKSGIFSLLKKIHA